MELGVGPSVTLLTFCWLQLLGFATHHTQLLTTPPSSFASLWKYISLHLNSFISSPSLFRIAPEGTGREMKPTCSLSQTSVCISECPGVEEEGDLEQEQGSHEAAAAAPAAFPPERVALCRAGCLL